MTLGEGIEAVAALASTGALIAALVGLRNQRKELALQRAELKLQREELAANREVMREQAEQAKATADAQRRLADSQEQLAKAQLDANTIAQQLEEAQRLAARAALEAAVASTNLAVMDPARFGGPEHTAARENVLKRLKSMVALLHSSAFQDQQHDQGGTS